MTDTKNWCRCPSPLPPKTEPHGRDWICSACGGERRYHEKMTIGNGGIVARCGECMYDARRTGAKVSPTFCRLVTCTTQLAGEIRSTDTYQMCDPCVDQEIARQHTADIIDGRQPAVAT